MRRFFFPSSGFTLIELLVVAGIIILTTGIGVAGYNSFTDKQKVEQASRELISNLKRAQNNAVIGRTACPATNTLAGWYVNFSNKTYYGQCTSPATTFLSTSLISGNYTLSPSNPTFNIIKFYPITGETNLTGDLTVTVSPTSNPRRITITRKGAISLNPNP